ncbi:MAG: hypothetical protein M4D85_04565 [Actinomycetota bacterium]|nr:hypothetical protein [Actinomycetota bacterium]
MTNVVPFDRLGEGNGARSRRVRAVMAGLLSAAATSTTLLVTAAPAEAIVPGPNGRIAFESNRTGDTEIWTMNPDGSVPLNITNSPDSGDVFPAWSPDGTRLTFSSDRADPGNFDVYVMNADGTGVTRLTDAPGEDRGTSWTSDGERIVFHSARDRDASHSFDVFTMKPDGTDQTKIFTNGSAAYVCGDSETGTIVFNSNGDPLGTNPVNDNGFRDFEIFTMDIDGSNVFQVTSNTVIDSGPKWSPDCSTISYNSLDTTSLDIFRIDADGSDRVNLTNTPGVFDAFSAWSPDGSRIVFSSNRDVNFEIYSMDAIDGGNVTRLTFTDLGQADFRADWGTGQILIDGPPQTMADCKNQGYKAYFRPESFKNQGQCVSYVQSNRRAKR